MRPTHIFHPLMYKLLNNDNSHVQYYSRMAVSYRYTVVRYSALHHPLWWSKTVWNNNRCCNSSISASTRTYCTR